MSDDNERDGLMRSLDRMRAAATRVEKDLVELHNIVRFDHKSPGARERAESLETELTRLAADVRRLRDGFAARDLS